MTCITPPTSVPCQGQGLTLLHAVIKRMCVHTERDAHLGEQMYGLQRHRPGQITRRPQGKPRQPCQLHHVPWSRFLPPAMRVKQHRHPAAQLQACRAHAAAAQAVASAEAARPPVVAVVCWHMPDMCRGAALCVIVSLSHWSLLHGYGAPGQCSTEECLV